jgi:hypothetical protein
MLFMWGPGGANTVRMGDALVIVPGAAAAGPGRRTVGELPSLPRRHLHPAGRPRSRQPSRVRLGAVAETGRGRSGPCVIDNREGGVIDIEDFF